MRKYCFILLLAASLFRPYISDAQTNIQFFYDFGSDRQHFTATIEGFYSDNWGSTFFFVDHDFNAVNENSLTYSPGSTYLEAARNLNFWQDSPFAAFSLHLEYNGGHRLGESFQNAFLAGIDYGFTNEEMKASVNLQLLYKYISYTDKRASSDLPLQFTATWDIQDIFGLKGLQFCGFADFWWEDQKLLYDRFGAMLPEEASTVFVSEPQLWYNLGSLFGCRQLKIGAEMELCYNFAAKKGFWCRPCAGLKWVF